MKRSINIVSNLDWFSVALWLTISVIGWINIYATGYDDRHTGIMDYSQQYGKQLIWLLASVVVAAVVILTDSRFYHLFSYAIYGGALFSLVLVLIFGKEVNSSQSWFEIGGISLQPAEFAKVATALALARYIDGRNINLTSTASLLKSLAIVLLPVALILLQPDLGSAVVYAAFVFVLYREGLNPFIFLSGIVVVVLFFVAVIFEELYSSMVIMAVAMVGVALMSRRYMMTLTLAVAIAGVAAATLLLDRAAGFNIGADRALMAGAVAATLLMVWYNFRFRIRRCMVLLLFMTASIFYIYTVDYVFHEVLRPHQRERINIVLGVESDPLGAGYNLHQSMISIGSGGLTGKGFLQGTQTKFRFVPEQSTDFIFCTVGEEWGFLGSAAVIVLYLVLLLRIQYVAERQRSVFSRVYGYSLFSVLFLHFFINIGMTVGLVPVIGIPLPFFSYGGSALWAFTAMLFILLRLDSERRSRLL